MPERESRSRKQGWLQNPNIQSALITGVLGLLGTFLTIRATRPPTPVPVDPLGKPIVNVNQPNSRPSNSDSEDTSQLTRQAVTLLPPGTAISQQEEPAPDLRLNFAEFQKRVAQIGLSVEQKEKHVNPLVGTSVVWRGYFDDWTPHKQPSSDAYFTVSLVETKEKVTQSMFKTPALFRMPIAQLEAVKGLTKGQQITLMGKLESHSLVGTILTDGRLIGSASTAPTHTARGDSSMRSR